MKNVTPIRAKLLRILPDLRNLYAPDSISSAGRGRMEDDEMTYEEERVVTRTDEHTTSPQGHTVSESTVARRPSPVMTIERVIVFIFGLIQALLLMRIVLLALAAREANPIVDWVYTVSEVFVAPFRGMFAMDTVPAGEAALDVAAIVALIGWTILELLILALVRVFRPTAAA